MPEPLTVVGAVTPVVTNALEAMGTTLGKSVGKFAKSIVDKAVVDLGIGFRKYLEASYDRCKHFKTILNQSQPLEVKKYYIHNTLSCGNKVVQDDELIDGIRKFKRVVITGLAGSGKSMFMKYLTVRRFEVPTGTIPLFIELRQLNSITQRDLVQFISASCTGKGVNVSLDQFRMALAAGAFIIILDGFDELNHEYRDEIQKQIIDISHKYPDTPIIISSRPDDRFKSWTQFHIYHVDKLTKDQALELIRSLEYDDGVKDRFYKEVSTRLYSSHESFLSSPLLTTIMLLTYEEFAEIPIKMHAFYSQAFDTLFQKHDASKEQYQRKTHTSLGREDFKFAFAAFCAMSYLNQQFSFEQGELQETAESAVKYIKQAKPEIRSVSAKGLLDDLKESVCLLQQDGLETAFVHRSFQEYFAAVFATGLHGEKIKKVLDKYALRFGDSVIAMAMEISRETVEQEWVLPVLDELRAKFNLDNSEATLSSRLRAAIMNFRVYRDGDSIFVAGYALADEVVGPLETICSLYPSQLGRALLVENLRSRLPEAARDFSQINDSDLKSYVEFKALMNAKQRQKVNSPVVVDLRNDDYEWLLNFLNLEDTFDKMRKGFTSIRRSIEQRAKKRRVILDEFL